MIEKRGRGQPKFEPTQEQRNQVKLMKALGIPEDRICTTITNPWTKKPVAPMTLARAFAPELESGATEFHAVIAPLDLETKRLRRLSPGALADEALALKKRIDAIKDEAIRRRLKTAEGVRQPRDTLRRRRRGESHTTARRLLLAVEFPWPSHGPGVAPKAVPPVANRPRPQVEAPQGGKNPGKFEIGGED